MRHDGKKALFVEHVQFICIAMLIALGSRPAHGGWVQTAFAGREVSALSEGQNLMVSSSPQAIFAAVADSGVFTISLVGDMVRRYPEAAYSGSDGADHPAGKVHSLEVIDDGVAVFAGTDSGLYTVNMISAAMPAWRPHPMIPAEAVFDIAYSDSVYCIAIKTRLYKSKNIFGGWSPCSLSGEILIPGDGQEFSSITSWPMGNGFAAGLKGSAGGAVYFGDQKAAVWSNISCIAGCTCIDNAVRSLVADSSGRLYANTSEGVFYGDDFDTGCWHDFVPQLELPINELKASGGKTSFPSTDLYAATDSGLYKWSQRASSFSLWEKIFDKKTFSVVITGDLQQPRIYAATDDGLWTYDYAMAIDHDQKRAAVRPDAASLRTITTLYTIDGKRISSHGRHLHVRKPMGVYIRVDHDRSGAVVGAGRLVQ